MAGICDYYIGHQKFFYPFGGPMNGQTARLEIVRSIIAKCEIEQIIETGTYRGTTTEWFSQFGIPVLSAEIEKRFAVFAQHRMARRSNVKIECIDSVAALARWSEASEVNSRRTLFYLDAHWKERLPLSEELEVISRNFNSWVVIIDDFKVPSDAGYGFDNYGPGQTLDMEYLNRSNIQSAAAFFPSVMSKWETGLKRGCIVLVANQEMANKCQTIPLLQSAPT